MEHYAKWIDGACSDIEQVYGLSQSANGKKASDCDIQELIGLLQTELANKGTNIIEQRNVDAFPHVGFVGHLSTRMSFFEQTVIDYRKFPFKKQLMESLTPFLFRSTLNGESRAGANVIGSVLDSIDSKHIELRYGMGYRILRLVLVFIVYENYADLSVLVRFVLSQLERSE
jgi:hypothetical protein